MLYKYIILFSLIMSFTNLFANSEKVSLQLKWKHQFQFAGFYIAKEKGFYKDVNLNVDIKEINEDINVVKDVISGKSTYGIELSSLLIDRSKNRPVVALSAILQSSPSVLVTTDLSIKNPKDLIGKRVMVTSGTYNAASLMAMLHSSGISTKDIKLQKHSYDYKDLINKNTDAMASYLTNEPYRLQSKGIKYNILNPKDYGFDFYGDILFTSEDELKNHPNRVKAFLNASIKGWLWAFDNIEESAKIIYEKYNSQNKSINSLIYEGYELKKLAFDENANFGQLNKKKFENIAKVYQVIGLLNKNYNLDDFLDPLGFLKKELKLGILAKRGYEKTIQRWQPLVNYLNDNQDIYNIKIVPLNFEELEDSVHKKDIDFVITNTMYYVWLEVHDGVTRIATLINRGSQANEALKEFGGVIFTRADNNDINSISDLKNKKFGAVNAKSFGGWIMAYDELVSNGITTNDINLKFLNTHDSVVYAVLNKEVDVGTVRSDTLERMAKEKLIDLSKIKIINKKHYTHYPYLVSTKLYPEWPFAKLKHTSDIASNLIVSLLLNIKPNSIVAQKTDSKGWTIPKDYTEVHNILKRLKLKPYDKQKITLKDVAQKYAIWLYLFGIILIFIVVRLIYVNKINKHLDEYNKKLNEAVKDKTKKLQERNKELLFETKFSQTILDKSPNIIITTIHGENLSSANRAFLEFFGYKNVKEFLIEHNCICDFFQKRDGYLYRDINGLNWIDYIMQTPNETHKILIKIGKKENIFKVNTAPIEFDEYKRYLVIFTDITNLENYSLNLEKEIKLAIEENRKQDQLLIQQAKMATMGEMISAIAHQWKQPLNTLALYIQDLTLVFEDEGLKENDIKEFEEKSLEQIDFMSQTINDFRNFFKASKDKEKFSVCESISEICRLLEAKMKKHQVELKFNVDKHFYILGYSNEFKQVILNIINNAIDVFSEKEIMNGKINVIIENIDKIGVITISDNGGGIPQELLPNKIFESYVTTKGDNGTGIGLQIAKTIIETHMNGEISAYNSNDGANFVIKLPIYELK